MLQGATEWVTLVCRRCDTEFSAHYNPLHYFGWGKLDHLPVCLECLEIEREEKAKQNIYRGWR